MSWNQRRRGEDIVLSMDAAPTMERRPAVHKSERDGRRRCISIAQQRAGHIMTSTVPGSAGISVQGRVTWFPDSCMVSDAPLDEAGHTGSAAGGHGGLASGQPGRSNTSIGAIRDFGCSGEHMDEYRQDVEGLVRSKPRQASVAVDNQARGCPGDDRARAGGPERMCRRDLGERGVSSISRLGTCVEREPDGRSDR
jgi:hypothetical protein